MSLQGVWLIEVLRDLQANGNDFELHKIFEFHPIIESWNTEWFNQDLEERQYSSLILELEWLICHEKGLDTD